MVCRHMLPCVEGSLNCCCAFLPRIRWWASRPARCASSRATAGGPRGCRRRCRRCGTSGCWPPRRRCRCPPSPRTTLSTTEQGSRLVDCMIQSLIGWRLRVATMSRLAELAAPRLAIDSSVFKSRLLPRLQSLYTRNDSSRACKLQHLSSSPHLLDTIYETHTPPTLRQWQSSPGWCRECQYPQCK